MNLIDPKDLAAAIGPVLDEVVTRVVHQATTELVPALGQQLQEGIRSAMIGLNSDSQVAIEQLGSTVEALVPKLEAAGERLIEKLKSEITGMEITVSVSFKSNAK
jgi:hypothetical protein